MLVWKKTLLLVRIQASVRPSDWRTVRRGVEEGKVEVEVVVQHVNGLPFLPWLPQIASEIQASLTSGRPAGIAGPTRAFISLGPDGTALESWHFHWWGEGRRAGEVKGCGREGCVGVWVNGRKINTVNRRRASSTFAPKSGKTVWF